MAPSWGGEGCSKASGNSSAEHTFRIAPQSQGKKWGCRLLDVLRRTFWGEGRTGIPGERRK